MHDLEITWPSGQARFTPDDSPIRVGRSPEAAIILTEPSVSRRHLEFVWTGSDWTASDYSTHGSFDPVGVRLASNWNIGTDAVIRLGGSEGVELQIELVSTRPGVPHSEVQHAPVAAPEAVAAGAAGMAPPAPPGAGVFDEAPPASDFVDEKPILNGDGPEAPEFAASIPLAPAEALEQPLPAPASGLFDDHPPQEAAASGLFADPPPSTNGNGASHTPTEAPSIFTEPAAPLPSGDLGAPAAPPPPPNGAVPEMAPPPPAEALTHAPPSSPVAPPPLDQAIPRRPAAVAPTEIPGSASPPPESNAGGITGAASATAITDSTLRLSIDSQDYVFMPGTEVTVGRDPTCLVTIDERHSLVSRRHLKFIFRDNAWWIDDYSSKGTFIDGRRISDGYEAQGAFVAHLGDDDAGTPMRVITAGEHQTPKQRQSMVVYAMMAFLALVALATLVLALQTRNDDSTVSIDTGTSNVSVRQSDVTKAKQGTVLLVSSQGLGSGFFVSDTLILTNQHVAAIDDSLFVAVSRQTDEPAQFEYEAEVVALHPFLDIAVMRITGDMNGEPVTNSGIEPLTVSPEPNLTLGESVYSTGFANQLSLITNDDVGDIALSAVGVSGGEAANFAFWPGCSNPSRDEFIPQGSPPGVTCSPDGDVSKAIVMTTFSSGEGASGSPVFKDDGDEVVAVVFAGPQDEANAGRNISASAFADWLDDIIAANQ